MPLSPNLVSSGPNFSSLDTTPAVAAGDVLGILQREATDLAHAADRFAAVERAPCLRAILDEDQLVLVGNLLQLRQLARVAGQVHGDDRFGFRRDLALDIRRVEAAGLRFKVGEYRHGLLEEHADHRPDIRDAGRDDLVAGRDAGGGHGDMQRRAARRAGLHVFVPIDRPEALHEQLRLLVVPVVKRVLLDGLAELLQLRFAPAHRFGHGPANGLRAAIDRELVGLVVSYFRHPKLAGSQ